MTVTNLFDASAVFKEVPRLSTKQDCVDEETTSGGLAPWDGPEEKSVFEWLDNIWLDSRFSAATKEAAYALAMYFRQGARICWPSLPQIWHACGQTAGKSERVTERLTPLVDAGWLERERRYEGRRATYVYALTTPTSQRRVLDDLAVYERFPDPFMSLTLAGSIRRPRGGHTRLANAGTEENPPDVGD